MAANVATTAIYRWVKAQERIIELEGRPLSSASYKDALSLGIKYPDKVRVCAVDKVVLPISGFASGPLGNFLSCRFVDMLSTDGVAYGYGIYVTKYREQDRALIYHELIHVKQMEDMGLENFIEKYVNDLVTFGYRESPLEQEAYSKTDEFRKTLTV